MRADELSGTQKYYANPKQRHTFSAVYNEDLWGMSLRTSTEPDLQRRAGAGRNETESDGTVRGGPGSEPDPRGPEPTGRRDMSEFELGNG